MTDQEQEPDFINYAIFREEALENYSELEIWDKQDSLSENIKRLISSCVVFPYPDIQLPLVVTYSLIPSGLCRVLPILLCTGASGTGKSTIGYLASKIQAAPILSSGDTFASIRNTLSEIKGTKYGREKNCMMIWDDIDKSIFYEKPDIYRMLKYGYDRSSDTISIASRNGENMLFRVFSPKIISTISPIHNATDLPELTRRCLVIQTKKVEQITTNDVELIDSKLIDYKGLSDEFNSLWHDIELCKMFAKTRKLLVKKKPKSVDSERWLISLDILTNGICLELFDSSQDAINWLKAYWDHHDSLMKKSQGSLVELIKDYLTTETERQKELSRLLETDDSIVIDAEKFKRQLEAWKQKGLVDIELTNKNIIEIMTNEGYKLTKRGWVYYG